MAPQSPDEDCRKHTTAGIVKMTPDLLREICVERNMWSQPLLNTQLFLNYKGFHAIEGLEDYVKVRALHLSNNNIARIEGLDRMTELRSLHLEGNRITKIEGLDFNLELRQLNLEGNAIRSVAGLSHLAHLEQINLAKNGVQNVGDLKELQLLPKLANVDVSHNQIDMVDDFVEFWSAMSARLKVLRCHGNPGINKIEHYRKRLINALPELTYLDERPVFVVERRSCAAWATGGLQAMHQAKREFHQEQHRHQCGVDPERRALLTNARKAALARIEREARERQEHEEKMRENTCDSSNTEIQTAVQTGDLTALAQYEKSWRTKLQLYGAEGVRSQAAAQDKGVPLNAQASTTNDHHTPAQRPHAFDPPSRSAGPSTEAALGGAAHEAPAVMEQSKSGRLNDAPRRPAGAAEFLQPRSQTDAEERQWTVVGDAEWATSGAASGSRTRPQLNRGSEGIVVVPEVWRTLGPSAAAAELELLDQNLQASKEWAVKEAPASRQVDCSLVGRHLIPPSTGILAADDLASLD